MKIFLASVLTNGYLRNSNISNLRDCYLLESFFYLRSKKEFDKTVIVNNENFLLDSGAFTYIRGGGGKTDWNKYIKEYANFINTYDIKYFFELDIDSVVGLEKVEILRHQLETMTHKRCIPVFHVSRGRDYFLKMCEEYEYIAIGGLITDGLTSGKLKKYLPWFIHTAHEHGTKLHGLGFTNNELLSKFKFDSVDSTTWNMCANYGEIFVFEKNRMVRHRSVENGQKVKKIKNIESATLFNFKNWIKYQRYANLYF